MVMFKTLRSKNLVIRLTLVSAWILAIDGTIAAPVPPPDFVSGQGTPQFQLGAVSSCSAVIRPFLENSAVFWRALDISPDGRQFLGVSEDELYEIDTATGATELIGHIGFSSGKRFWFSECEDSLQVFRFPEVGLAGPVHWSFRATVGLSNEDGLLSEFVIEEQGTRTDGSQLGTIVDLEFEEPGIIQAQLELEFTADGTVHLALTRISGSGTADVSGMFVVVTPNAIDGEPIPLPVTSLTVAHDHGIYVLSDPQWDPYGEAAIYELDLTSDPVMASYVSTPDASNIQAIEFTDGGKLLGAGEGLYSIDPLTGDSILLSEIVGANVLEMDYSANNRLYAMVRQDNGASAVMDISPDAVNPSTLAFWNATPYWSLVVPRSDPGDLNSDGDVDIDDLKLFDAQVTGVQIEPIVPPGPPEPHLTSIVVPFGENHRIRAHGARYFMDATTTGVAGTVVEGVPTDDRDTSAVISAIHNGVAVGISIQIVDDHRSDQAGEDVVELYLDSNNSDSVVREGNVDGFQATFDSRGIKGGDAAAFAIWDAASSSPYRPGPRIQFWINSAAANMETGGTYGFDVAIRDTDDLPSDSVKYFLFSQDASGEQNEGQWGEMFLAPGPLPAQASNPTPANREADVSTNPQLAWTNPSESTHSRLYLGAHPDELRFQGRLSSDFFSPGTISPGTTYYWRVDSVNSNGLRRGRVWQFTTTHLSADSDGDGDVDEHDRRQLFQRPLGDTTGDGAIDDADLTVVVSALGASVGDRRYSEAVDYDSDGVITQVDVSIWQCHSLLDGNEPTGDVNGDGLLDDEDIAHFVDCLHGPTGGIDAGCLSANLIFDNRVDLRDAAKFQQIFGAVQFQGAKQP